MLRRNMRQEFITAEELMAQLRENGLDDCKDVQAACMEADGSISIVSPQRQMTLPRPAASPIIRPDTGGSP